MSPRQTTPGRNNITSSDSHKGNRAWPQTRGVYAAAMCRDMRREEALYFLFYFSYPGLGSSVAVSVKQAHVIDLKCKPRARGHTDGATTRFWDTGTFFTIFFSPT